MPWPDFSEFSFGYSFLREFERTFTPGGSFPLAPDFISQFDEADKGYDVEVALQWSAPMFFQFKRSYVLTGLKSNEILSGDFPGPILYRMELRPQGGYRQHKRLRELEKSGKNVLYVTSQVPNSTELSRAYRDGAIVSRATALFSPLEIDLPNYKGRHHVSFKAAASYGLIYSESGVRFPRSFPQADSSLMERLAPRLRSADQNRAMLSQFVAEHEEGSAAESSSLGLARQIASRVSDVTIKASIYAFLIYDCHLTFFGGKRLKSK